MAHLALAFLGTFQARLDEEPLTSFRSANNQGLLVYLALNQDRAISREVLAALFWPDESDKNGRNNLRQAIYQLRTLLGDTKSGDNPQLIVTRKSVQFNPVGDHALDVAHFLSAVDARDLETAVSLYRGELLPGFTCDSLPFEEWLRQERESLHHLGLEAMFELTADHLDQGHFDQAQTIARRQLAIEPWREPAHRQLMRAYALSGDRAQAVAQYELCRDTLWEELCLEPAEETNTLIAAVKAGSMGPASQVERLAPPPRFQHNLPASTTPLIGREIEMEQVSGLLLEEHRRLVTVVGPGGMGKTRLAIALGAVLLQDFDDGVFFVDLAPLNQPQEIFLAMMAALDYQVPDTNAELAPQLLDMLSRRQLLLILDNFEHLLAGAAVVNEILQRCPRLSLLVTSRQRLNLASESRYELGGLEYPVLTSPEDALGYTAVELFVDSGRRANSRFELTDENVADVVGICKLVQGVPLALLLAASWLEILTPAEIAAEIEKCLGFLASDLADLPERQRSMQAVFDRTWEMMSGAEQEVMAKLSVFRSGFTRGAAEKVAGANLRVLLSLVNMSLLQRHTDNGRFAMHELLRQYAADRRRKSDYQDDTSLAHCRYFAGEVDQALRGALGFHPIQLPQQLGRDRDNIGQAWYYALEKRQAAELVILVQGVASFLVAQGILPGPIIDQSLAALHEAGLPDTDWTILRLRLLALSYRIGPEGYRTIRPLMLEFLPVVDACGDPELRFWTYERLCGLTFDSLGNEEDVIAEWNEAFQAALATEDELFIKMAESMELSFYVDRARASAEDLSRLQEMLAYFEPRFPLSNVVFNLLRSTSTYYMDWNEYEQAIRYGKRCLGIAKEWQDLFWISMGTDQLAEVYSKMGRPDLAGLQHLDALDWHLAIGQMWQTLGNIWAKVTYFPETFGGPQTVVPILSMVYHHPEVMPYHRQRIEESRAYFSEQMGAEAFAAAWEKGKVLEFETAVAQVRAAMGSGEP